MQEGTNVMQPLWRPTEKSSAMMLRYMYIGTSALSALMVFWILIFPASWLAGRSKLQDGLINKLVTPDGIVPLEITQKYAGHTAVHLTHHLPGAIWAAAIPFQLHPTFRKNRPTLHRTFGYTFFASALAIAVGILVIISRDLVYTKFYPELPPPDVNPEYTVCALGLYFVFTIVNAIRCAVRRQFAAHQRWIIRHISSGIWVALQRVLIISISPFGPFERATQRQAFGDAARIATIICFVLGEMTVRNWLPPEYKKRVE